MPLKYTRKPINELVARGKPGTTRVASGLYIVVKRPMIARWLFRYQLHGKRTEITLGGYSETDKLLLSFAEAKNKSHCYMHNLPTAIIRKKMRD